MDDLPGRRPRTVMLTLAQLAGALARVECGHAWAVIELDLDGNRCRYRCPTCGGRAGWQSFF